MVNIAIATTIGMGGGAEGRETGRGEELFQKSCVACHVNGGNILAPGKGLTLKELGLNLGAATFDEVYRITYYGKGKMPGYGTECQPRGACTFAPRLTDDEVGSIATYVVGKAESGW